MKVFESESDCPVVEKFIWNAVDTCHGDFCGIKELDFADLIALRSLIDHQIQLNGCK